MIISAVFENLTYPTLVDYVNNDTKFFAGGKEQNWNDDLLKDPNYEFIWLLQSIRQI